MAPFEAGLVCDKEEAEEKVQEVHAESDPVPQFDLLGSVVDIVQFLNLGLIDLSVLVSTALKDCKVLDFFLILVHNVVRIAHRHADDRSNDEVGKVWTDTM